MNFEEAVEHVRDMIQGSGLLYDDIGAAHGDTVHVRLQWDCELALDQLAATFPLGRILTGSPGRVYSPQTYDQPERPLIDSGVEFEGKPDRWVTY